MNFIIGIVVIDIDEVVDTPNRKKITQSIQVT